MLPSSIAIGREVSYQTLLRHKLVNELRGWPLDGGSYILCDGQPIGYAHQDDSGLLDALELLPAYRGKGIARRVLEMLATNGVLNVFGDLRGAEAAIEREYNITDLTGGHYRLTRKSLPGVG